MHLSATALVTLVGMGYASANKELNNSPIIGLFTQPSSSSEGNCGGDCLYLAASYVKQIESAGARVVPINYYAGKEEIDHLFHSLNGFLYVGGGASLPDSAQRVFDKTVEANDNGDFSPLWGTCLGFEWLLMAATKDVNILDPSDGTQMDAYNISLPLSFTPSAATSKLFAHSPPGIYDILATQNVTMNNHHYGIFTEHFYKEDALTSFFEVLSTNEDRQGVDFISTMEAHKYPIYATQWHPEKNIFEWNLSEDGTPYEAINHSPAAVQVTQYITNFFIGEARKSSHTFSDPEEETARLIYNYDKVKSYPNFVEKYYFANDF